MIKARSINDLVASLESEGYNTEILSNAFSRVLNGESGKDDRLAIIRKTSSEGFVYGFMSGLVMAGIIDVLTYAYCFEEITGRKQECTH